MRYDHLGLRIAHLSVLREFQAQEFRRICTGGWCEAINLAASYAGTKDVVAHGRPKEKHHNH